MKKRKSKRRGNGCLLNGSELAVALGEESRTITTWRKRGIIPWIDAGYRTKRYKLADVLAALEKRTIRALPNGQQ
jgi:hypothetical protein